MLQIYKIVVVYETIAIYKFSVKRAIIIDITNIA